MAELKLLPEQVEKVALENLDQLWRPVLVASRGIGAFPFVAVKGNRKVPWWRNWWNFFSFIYTADVLVCLSLITYVAVRKAAPASLIDASAKYLANFAFYVHAALSSAIFIYILNCKTYLRDLCQLWTSLRFRSGTADELNANVKRKVRCCLAWSMVGGLVYVLAYVGLFVVIGDSLNYLTIFVWSSHCWFVVANAIHIGLFCAICCTASCLLKGICQDLPAIEEDKLDLHLHWFRDVYTAVIEFVDVCNWLFGNFLGFLISSYLVQACCSTYLFFPYSFHSITILAFDGVFFLDSFVIIFIVCLVVGKMVEKGKLPYRIFLKTKLPNSPSNEQIQALVLLLDVSRNMEAKMDMFGIIPITKSMLPVLFGMYLSYVFLLYQLPQGSATVVTSQHVANDTTSM